MCGGIWFAFTLWITILNESSAKGNFKMKLRPLNPVVVHVGDVLELNCSVSCPSADRAVFSWRTVDDSSHGGDVTDEINVSRLLFRNISLKHDKKIVCTASCGEKRNERTSEIKVYSFPTDPVLPRIKQFKANQQQRLNCTLHNIYPSHRFTIELLSGDETIHIDEPDMSDHEDVQDFSTTFNYTPSVADLGKNISCKATLNLGGVPANRSSRTTTAEYGPGTMTVSTNNALVQLGKDLEITCHADGNPQPIISWKTWENKTTPESQNEKLIIRNASWSQAGWYRCEATNLVGSLQMPVQVIVQGPLKIPKIQLRNGGDPSEGDNITILCSSDTGTTALKLSRENQVAEVLNRSEVLLNIPSIKVTDAGVYVCEAKNDFGIKSSTINITVKEQQTLSVMPNLPAVIVPTAGSASLLTVATLLIRYLRKARRDPGNISVD